MASPSIARSVLSRLATASILLACLAAGRPAEAASPYTLFESGHVRPLALSPDGKLLFAVNRPTHELEGFLYVGAGLFVSNRVSAPAIGDAALRQRAWNNGGELTYTCVPPGSGVRIGLDRDDDGFRDGDEEDEGSDPADAGSTPVP